MIREIGRKLGFNRKRGEFELLETEKGAPGFWGGWTETEDINLRGAAGISSGLKDNLDIIRRDFRADINSDLIIRRFTIGKRLEAAAVYLNGMVRAELINDFILREGMRKELPDKPPYACFLVSSVIAASEMCLEGHWKPIKDAITDGKTAVFLEGENLAIVVDSQGYEYRAIGMPQNEKVVMGPQEGFNENLRTNITLIRRRVRRPDLVCEFRDVGNNNNLKAGIMYLEGVANPALVQEVKQRLGEADARMVLSTGILEQLTESRRFSPVPQLLSTERPDRAASHIMQGCVIVMLDGSPFANITPTTLYNLMSSAEDDQLRQPQGSAVRVVRYIGALISILLPGYFLSLVLYHQGVMSTEVLSTVVASRKMVFAPIGLELLFLLMVFQLIREAGLRVPGSIGQAIGIIGGLILGQAAVSANLASSVILIVVALAGLGNFCIPSYPAQIAASYIRGALVVAAWLGGLLGISCGLIVFFGYMSALKSYGVPFLTPVAPKTCSKRPAVLRGPITARSRTEDYVNTREDS